MSNSIPGQMGFFLGDVIPKEKLNALSQTIKQQEKAEQALSKLNAAIAAKRNLNMVIQDLVSMEVDIADIQKKINDLNIDQKIVTCAEEYAKEQFEAEVQNSGLKATDNTQEANTSVNDSMGNIIDFSKAKIKGLPLAYDSMKMDARYFSAIENSQSTDPKSDINKKIKSFTSNIFSIFDSTTQSNITSSIAQTLVNQWQNHNLDGTLIITATCTHKMSSILDPFEIDLDKALQIWNSVNNKIDPFNLSQELQGKSSAGEESLGVICGANYGSSFIGMVHIFKNTATASSQSYIKDSFELNRKLGSNQNVISHMNLIVMGDIVGIKPTSIAEIGIKELAEINFQKPTISTTQNANQKQEGQVNNSYLEQLSSMMLSLKKIEDKEPTKALSINSLLDAFDKYIEKISKDTTVTQDRISAGIPISFYIKNVTRDDIIEKLILKQKLQNAKEVQKSVVPDGEGNKANTSTSNNNSK